MQIYSTLKSEYGALNHRNTQLLKEISFDNTLSSSINNVAEDTQSNELVINSANIIAKLAEEWQTLDSSDVPLKRKVNGTGKRSSVTVPYGWNHNDIATLDHYICEGVSDEYLNRLSDIMCRIPDLTGGMGSAGDDDPFNTDGSFLDQPTLRKDLFHLPELALSFGKGRKTNISTEYTQTHETVFSFALYKDDGGGKAHLPRQCVEVLGGDSVAQLMQAVHCVHSTDTGATETAAAFDEVITMSPSTRKASDRGHANADGVLFVEGGLYCLPCRPAGEGTDSCCTCPAPDEGPVAPSLSDSSNSTSSSYDTALRMRDWLQQCLTSTASALPTATEPTRHARRRSKTAAVATQGESSMDNLNSQLVIMEDINSSNRNVVANKRRRGGGLAKAFPVPGGGAATAAPTNGGNKQKRRQSAGASKEAEGPITVSASANKRTNKNKNAPATVDCAAVPHATSGTDHPTATAVTAGASHRFLLSQLRLDALQVLCAKAMRCDSVQWQIGVPYLYTHAAGCEHVLYLTNIILPQCGNIVHTQHGQNDHSSNSVTSRPSSPPSTATGQARASRALAAEARSAGRFPRESYRARAKQRRCRVCDLRAAQYVLFGDRLADCSPCLYCEHCYHMLHYTAEGALLYDDFHVFPYTHDA